VIRRVETGADSAVWIGAGVLERAPEYLFSPSGRFLLVSSAGPRAAAARVRERLSDRLLLDLSIDDREEAKTLESVRRIAEAALEADVRRDDAFVAVGGGVVSDVVGFAAAIVLRGLPWNVVPTTTGAMADAAVGGKTGVDTKAGKNVIGAFHPPRRVLIDPSTLEGLPDRDFRAGLVEAFKAAWIADRDLAARGEGALTAILARREEPLLDLLGGAVEVKAAIVSEDLREGDRRRLLNFGHTLGHAFEAAAGFRGLKHGEAVAWGIAAALEISSRRAGLSPADAVRIRATLSTLGPFPEPERDATLLAPYLARDKKKTARGIAGVLLEFIGKARVEESIPSEEWLEAARIARLS
jgi:3-dehydroquinate synthase